MNGRMHKSKCRCNTKLKAKYEASPSVVATNGNTNKQKEVVVVSDSSSSSSNSDFNCSSCPRKFSTQQALAGHMKIHKGEWQSRLDKPDHRKIDRFQIEASLKHKPKTTLKRPSSKNPCSLHQDTSSTTNKPLLSAQKYPANAQKEAGTSAPLCHVAKTTNAPKEPSPSCPSVNPTGLHKISSPMLSFASPTNTLNQPLTMYHLVNYTSTFKASPTNTLQGPSTRSHLPNLSDSLNELSARFPYASPKNTFQGSSGFSIPNVFPNAINTHSGQSLVAPQQSRFETTPHVPSIQDLNQPPIDSEKAHGKSAIGVRNESMIHKPNHPRRAGQSDMLRTGSSLFGREQMMGGNIRGFGINNGHADLRALLTVAGSITTSRYDGGGSSNAHHNLISSSFQPMGGRGIVAGLFPLMPPNEIHHNGIAHSSQGLVPKPDHNGEDVDLDLKL